MTRGLQPTPRQPIESGVTVYGSGNLTAVEFTEADKAVIESTVAVYNHNHRRRHTFAGENRRIQKDAVEHRLPAGVDPHDPVMRLAKAALRYSHGFMASVDTTVSKISWQATERASEELRRLTDSSTFGFIFVVERQEDEDNERILQLRSDVSEIAVPTLVILTSEPEAPPTGINPLEDTPTDLGPGIASLG